VSAEANPALQQLGRRLAQARQACGLSLEEQADRLNMGREQLQALEAGDRDLLPEAVFVIAQARRVANSLGIEINAEIEALRCSDGFRPQRPLRQASLGSPSEPTAGRVDRAQASPARRSGTGRSALLALTALLGAAAAVALVIRQGLPRLTTGQAAPPPPPVTSAKGTRTAADTSAELVLQSSEPSWLEVRSADGRTLFRGTLDAEQRFPLDGEIAVLAGRPDLVMVSIGRSEPTPMGSIQEVRWRRFRAEQAPPP
jgi:cytoskeletal protein RodZ